SYRVIVERRLDGAVVAEATVKVIVDGERVIATKEGNGPINALDAALRAALAPSCPWLDGVELADFKVRILSPRHSSGHGTDAVTRVLLESADRSDELASTWTTVGVHGNVVEASWLAMVDALTYASLRHGAVGAEVPAARDAADRGAADTVAAAR
ncbi:MAG TPA: alpha-isopropylmalate synthase regulatory domain-containing protein, partial [Pseudonocardia sp.]|nr:alpha-isopropylmalate synthase regulatory domain-containing protein [Pseudonocardia sp.]